MLPRHVNIGKSTYQSDHECINEICIDDSSTSSWSFIAYEVLYIQGDQTLLSSPNLASPYPHHSILPPLCQISILDPHPLNTARMYSLFFCVNASTAIPVPPINFIVDLGNRVARSSDDTARIEHHACDGIIVGVGVVDGAGAEVPYLLFC